MIWSSGRKFVTHSRLIVNPSFDIIVYKLGKMVHRNLTKERTRKITSLSRSFNVLYFACGDALWILWKCIKLILDL